MSAIVKFRDGILKCRSFSCRDARHVPKFRHPVAEAGKPYMHLVCQGRIDAWAGVLQCIADVFVKAVMAEFAALTWSDSDTILHVPRHLRSGVLQGRAAAAC